MRDNVRIEPEQTKFRCYSGWVDGVGRVPIYLSPLERCAWEMLGGTQAGTGPDVCSGSLGQTSHAVRTFASIYQGYTAYTSGRVGEQRGLFSTAHHYNILEFYFIFITEQIIRQPSVIRTCIPKVPYLHHTSSKML